MRPSESPPMRMHLFGWMGVDSKAVREGKVEYWNRVPVNVPYGDSGRGDGVIFATVRTSVVVITIIIKVRTEIREMRD